eukprot:TRINITY_DN20955_c0_g1_i2.p1 TRINITY_DN20955_c0_g1~~TRINITY_DN20955_c0_g1_i2.p1  ORF type:complete len:263 (+),score=42.31 TRINITY_DN20955_c0_g1_i2:73-861(+)
MSVILFVTVLDREQCVEVPMDATVGDVLEEMGLPRQRLIVYGGQRLSDPGQTLADAGVCPQARLEVLCSSVEYGSLAPRGPDCYVVDEDDDCEVPVAERWMRSSYGGMGDGDIWGQMFIAPDGVSSLVAATFRFVYPGDIHLTLHRCLETAPTVGNEVLWQSPVRSVVSMQLEAVKWDIPASDAPVEPGSMYMLVIHKQRCSEAECGDHDEVNLGHADSKFSEASGGILRSTHFASRSGPEMEQVRWGVLGGGDLAFLFEFV